MPANKIRRIWLLVMLLCSWLANPLASMAHPMGNFSISHYAGIRIESGFIEVHYLIDMAEIPTFQEMQDTGVVSKEGDPTLAAYLAKKSDLLAAGLALEVNGQPVKLQLVSDSVIFPPGAGGLPTMKLGFVYRAELGNPSSGSTFAVHYRDNNFVGRAGWKEIVVTAETGLEVTASSAPAADRSAQLSNYPTDLLSSPPQDLAASFTFSRPSSAAKNMAASNGIPSMPMQASRSGRDNTVDGQIPSAKLRSSQILPSRSSETSQGGQPPKRIGQKPTAALKQPLRRCVRISRRRHGARSRS